MRNKFVFILAGLSTMACMVFLNGGCKKKEVKPLTYDPYYHQMGIEWAVSAGDLDDDRCTDIVSLSDDSLFVVGYFSGSMTFGRGEPNEATLQADNTSDLFLAKYDSDGVFATATQIGFTNSYEYNEDMEPFSDNTFMLTGRFYDSITFGKGEANETTLVDPDEYGESFMAKYDSDGELINAKKVAHGGGVYSHGISTFDDGSFVATGFFSSSTVFGLGEPGEVTVSTNSSSDIFLAKYNPDLTLRWLKIPYTSRCSSGNEVVALQDGSSIVTGSFEGNSTFGLGEPNEISIDVYNTDAMFFIAKYGNNGTFEWVKTAVRTHGTGIDAHPDGSAIVTGTLYINSVFGQGEPNETLIESPFGSCIFFARYEADGSLAWAKSVPSHHIIECKGMKALPDGSCYVMGFGIEDSIFEYGTVYETRHPYGTFFSKYEPDGTMAWTKFVCYTWSKGLAFQSDNSPVICGLLWNYCYFGSYWNGFKKLSSEDACDIFLAKLVLPQ